MASVQAKMAIFFLRKLRNRAFKLIDNLEDFRKDKEKVFSSVRPPRSIKIKHFDINGIEAASFLPSTIKHSNQVVLYLHGGGYTSGSIKSHSGLIGKLAKETGLKYVAINYGLAPEKPFPVGLDNAITAYQWLLEEAHYHPQDIIIMGDSAGGGLTLSTLLKLKASKQPQPLAAVVISPWTDLTMSGDSALNQPERDPILTVPKASEWAGWYGGNDLKNPLVSPLYGDLTGLPPILIQVGTEEILLSDAVRFAMKAALTDVDITLDIWDDMPHVWHFFWQYVPESKAAIQKIVGYLDEKIATVEIPAPMRISKRRLIKQLSYDSLQLGKAVLKKRIIG